MILFCKVLPPLIEASQPESLRGCVIARFRTLNKISSVRLIRLFLKVVGILLQRGYSGGGKDVVRLKRYGEH